MTFKRPTLTEIESRLRAKVNAQLQGADANLRFSPEAVLTSVIAMASHEMHGYISYIANQILVDTSSLEYLERHATIWNISRKDATKSIGIIEFNGSDGAIIPAGTIIKRGDDVEYVVNADITIIGVIGQGTVTAVENGDNTNANIGVKLSLISPIIGVQSEGIIIDNGSGGGLTSGTNIESDQSLRDRVLARIKQPPHGGADFDYIKWAKEISGVTRSWAYPRQYGLGTVGVAFVMDNKTATIIPDIVEITSVQNHINTLKPVTADVTVFAPTLFPVDFEIALNPNLINIKNAVKAEIEDLFIRESEPGKTILISHIREAISVATGEFDHVVITPTANINLSFGQMASVGTFIWGSL